MSKPFFLPYLHTAILSTLSTHFILQAFIPKWDRTLLVPFPVRALVLSFSVFTGVSLGCNKPKCTVYWTGENWQFESIMPFPETGSILILGNYFGSAGSVFQAAALPKVLVSQVQKILLI